MSLYSGKATIIDRPVAETYNFFSDLTALKARFESLPEEARQKLGEVNFEENAIVIVTPQVGALRLEVVERRAPEKIVYAAANSPIPARIVINFNAVEGDRTELSAAFDVDVPAIMRPFVGPKLQKAADGFGEMFGQLIG